MTGWARFKDRYLVSGDAHQTERIVEMVTIGLVILLLLQLLFSGLRLTLLSAPDAISPSIEGVAEAQLAGVERASSAQSEEISARPLFWASRRPLAVADGAEAEASRSATKQGSLSKVKLVGLFGSGKTAGIIAVVGERKLRIMMGEQVEGWTLESVERNTVEFTNGSRREKRTLVQENAAPSRAPKPAAKVRKANTPTPSADAKQDVEAESLLGWGAVGGNDD